MTHRIVQAAALGLLWMVSCASQVFAQDTGAPVASAAPVQSSVLALAVGPGVVDRVALRAALEEELGVVVEDAGNAPAYMPTLSVVTLPNGNTEVALSSRTIPRSTREFLLSAQIPEERVEMVTLIAANLIRNEAAALLPELKPKPRPVVVEEPPKPAEPPAQLTDPCTPVRPREFGIDLAPGVGASSQQRGRTATRAFSLSFAGSLYDRLQGLDFAWTGASIVRKSVCGAQVSGGATVSWGPVVGGQFAIFNLIKGSLTGGQAGIASVAIGDVTGGQAAVVTINHGHLRGGQVGVANYVRHGFEGAQAGVLNLSLGASQGAQLGVANYSGSLRGIQAGVLDLAIGDVSGTQLGVANVATGRVRGLQLGVFNYADRSDASIGLLSIVRHGRTSIDLTGAIDSSLVMASVTHGGKYVHNILGVGLRANPNDNRFATVYGVGFRALRTRWLRLDIDFLSHNVYTSDARTKGVSMLASVRVPVTVMIARGFGVMAAVSYNFSILDQDETRELNNFASTSVQRGDPNVRGWPGATFGLRYEFDHGL